MKAARVHAWSDHSLPARARARKKPAKGCQDAACPTSSSGARGAARGARVSCVLWVQAIAEVDRSIWLPSLPLPGVQGTARVPAATSQETEYDHHIHPFANDRA